MRMHSTIWMKSTRKYIWPYSTQTLPIVWAYDLCFVARKSIVVFLMQNYTEYRHNNTHTHTHIHTYADSHMSSCVASPGPILSPDSWTASSSAVCPFWSRAFICSGQIADMALRAALRIDDTGFLRCCRRFTASESWHGSESSITVWWYGSHRCCGWFTASESWHGCESCITDWRYGYGSLWWDAAWSSQLHLPCGVTSVPPQVRSLQQERQCLSSNWARWAISCLLAHRTKGWFSCVLQEMGAILACRRQLLLDCALQEKDTVLVCCWQQLLYVFSERKISCSDALQATASVLERPRKILDFSMRKVRKPLVKQRDRSILACACWVATVWPPVSLSISTKRLITIEPDHKWNVWQQVSLTTREKKVWLQASLTTNEKKSDYMWAWPRTNKSLTTCEPDRKWKVRPQVSLIIIKKNLTTSEPDHKWTQIWP